MSTDQPNKKEGPATPGQQPTPTDLGILPKEQKGYEDLKALLGAEEAARMIIAARGRAPEERAIYDGGSNNQGPQKRADAPTPGKDASPSEKSAPFQAQVQRKSQAPKDEAAIRKAQEAAAAAVPRQAPVISEDVDDAARTTFSRPTMAAHLSFAQGSSKAIPIPVQLKGTVPPPDAPRVVIAPPVAAVSEIKVGNMDPTATQALHQKAPNVGPREEDEPPIQNKPLRLSTEDERRHRFLASVISDDDARRIASEIDNLRSQSKPHEPLFVAYRFMKKPETFINSTFSTRAERMPDHQLARERLSWFPPQVVDEAMQKGGSGHEALTNTIQARLLPKPAAPAEAVQSVQKARDPATATLRAPLAPAATPTSVAVPTATAVAPWVAEGRRPNPEERNKIVFLRSALPDHAVEIILDHEKYWREKGQQVDRRALAYQMMTDPEKLAHLSPARYPMTEHQRIGRAGELDQERWRLFSPEIVENAMNKCSNQGSLVTQQAAAFLAAEYMAHAAAVTGKGLGREAALSTAMPPPPDASRGRDGHGGGGQGGQHR